jgi:hypothetical protein
VTRSTLASRILIAGGLAGCAIGCMPVASHQGADLSKVDEFHIEKNKTTEKELVDRFGLPGNTLTRGDGTKTLSWNDSRGQGTVNGTKFIPVVGLFTGNLMDQKITQRSLTATVRDGVVVDYTTSDGNSRMAF